MKRQTSTEIADANGELASSSDSGNPGKRKRKPSSFAGPPTTLTKSPPPHQQQPSAASASSGQSSLKVRLNQKTGPGFIVSEGHAASTQSSRPRIKIRHSAGSSLKKHLNRAVADHGEEESEGEGFRRDIDGAMDADMEMFDGEGDLDHLEAPPLIFQRGTGTFGPAHRRQSRPRKSRTSATTSRLPEHQSELDSSPVQHQMAVFDGFSPSKRFPGHHSRTKSLSALSNLANLAGSGALRRVSVELHPRMIGSSSGGHGDLSGAETTDAEEDEDDFHRAMLDTDFESFGDLAEVWEEGLQHHRHHQGAELDTPATTPRSPQSSCDHPLQEQQATTPAHAGSTSTPASTRSSTDPEGSVSASATSGVDETPKPAATPRSGTPSKMNRTPSHQDSVFSHALAPSSRRTQTHAGLLTLSLPYHESKVVYATPISSRKAGEQQTISRFTTPILGRHHGDASEAQRTQTTSPPLSPTQALMGLPKSEAMIASPFLSAVAGAHAPISRSNSPDANGEVPGISAAFELPPPVMTAVEDENAPSPASTTGELPDVSPFPNREHHDSGSELGDELVPSQGIERLSSEGHDVNDDSGIESSQVSQHPDGRAEEGMRQPFFGLPETMDLDEIDVAYGGDGKRVEIAPMTERTAKREAVEDDDEAEQEDEANISTGSRKAKRTNTTTIQDITPPNRKTRGGRKSSPLEESKRMTRSSPPAATITPIRATRAAVAAKGGRKGRASLRA